MAEAQLSCKWRPVGSESAPQKTSQNPLQHTGTVWQTQRGSLVLLSPCGQGSQKLEVWKLACASVPSLWIDLYFPVENLTSGCCFSQLQFLLQLRKRICSRKERGLKHFYLVSSGCSCYLYCILFLIDWIQCTHGCIKICVQTKSVNLESTVDLVHVYYFYYPPSTSSELG